MEIEGGLMQFKGLTRIVELPVGDEVGVRGNVGQPHVVQDVLLAAH